jgi:cellulose synthase/poly-beta-1,6-N-acetylglucosamine synthase-like glycosyltransferase
VSSPAAPFRMFHRRSAGPKAVPHYISADTAPPGFAVRRPAWITPLLLLTFAALSAAVLPLLPSLTSLYARTLATIARVDPSVLLHEASLSFRPFFVIFMIVLSAFAVGSSRERLRTVGFSLGLYMTALLIVDVLLVMGMPLGAPKPFSNAGGIAAGCVGLIALVVIIFRRYELPLGVRVATRMKRSPKYALVLPFCSAVAVIVILGVLELKARYLHFFHGIPILGGLSSVVVLFLLAMSFLLYTIGILQRRSKPVDGPLLSIAFLVPAYNEAEGIEECIQALDAAASNYRGVCRLYVVDNASTDATHEVANRALSLCRALKGTVLHCPQKGKAHALNLGLRHITEDLVLRVDADTLVLPTLLQKLIPHFWDPTVGGASGVPLPKNPKSLLGRVRTIEVYYGVVFLRVGHCAMDAVMVLPGIAAAYRRELLLELGGFGEGFNGEDADLTVRMGRLGCRIVSDPDAKVMTEVPSLPHLREQRQRWARGLFHMAARNMSAVRMHQGARALCLLPWAILNSSRRCLMIPILICAGTVELLEPTVFTLREVSVIGGFIVGLQLLVITIVLVGYRKWEVIPFVPLYLVFRIFRAYVALEALLSLQLKAATVTAPVSVSPVAAPSAGNVQTTYTFERGAFGHPVAGDLSTVPAMTTGIDTVPQKFVDESRAQTQMTELLKQIHDSPDDPVAAAEYIVLLAEAKGYRRLRLEREERLDTLIREMAKLGDQLETQYTREIESV